MVRLSLGATCLLSAKVAEKQNMVRKLKHIIKRKQDEREVMTWSGLKNLNLLLPGKPQTQMLVESVNTT